MSISSDVYHAKTIRYLTQYPDMEATIELLSLSRRMTYLNKKEFIASFDIWEDKLSSFLKREVLTKRPEKVIMSIKS